MRLVVLSTISALLLVACSDDTQTPPKADQKISTADLALREAQAPKPDGVTTSDGKPAGSDGPGTNLSCGAATTYAQTCTKGCPTGAGLLPCLVKCNDDALKAVCASGKALMEKLVTCISTTCITDCSAGATPACETCTKDKCKADYDACYAHSC
jgi:hypothetical protein